MLYAIVASEESQVVGAARYSLIAMSNLESGETKVDGLTAKEAEDLQDLLNAEL